MTAWEKLKAASQLAAGTAWQLISNPKLGGAGVVVNDGVQVELADVPLAMVVDLEPLVVELTDEHLVIELAPGVAVDVLPPPNLEIS